MKQYSKNWNGNDHDNVTEEKKDEQIRDEGQNLYMYGEKEGVADDEEE